MKITVDIDCTPEEARTFFGLPDWKPMQDAVMADMQERMRAALAGMDPETLMKNWLPMQAQNLEQLQAMFWSQFTGSGHKEKKE